MRTKSTIKNAMFSSANMIITIMLTFIYRTVFIQTLGVEYLGLNAVYTNILMILSLAELGVGQAIAFSLYKPISINDKEKVNALIQFYKKVYRYIGIGVLILGIGFMPFIHILIPSTSSLENIYLIFILFLFNSSLTYFWGYKRTLIIADQKEYKLVPFTTVSQISDISLRIICLLIMNSFVFALVIQLFVKFFENVFINRYIDKEYDYIQFNDNRICSSELSVIKKNVKAMMMHKLGDISVNGTDNLIISSFIGVAALGVYSNYAMIIGIVISLFALIINSSIASLGNVIATESIERSEEVFDTVDFMSCWLFGWGSICFYILAQPFISLWLNDDFLLNNTVVILIAVNLFLLGPRASLGAVKSAGGIYTQDKYSPLIQGAVNLIISLILVKSLGITGVLLGTLLSSLFVPLWHRPYVVYKYLFKKSPLEYYKKLVFLSLSFFIIAVITKIIVDEITTVIINSLFQFFISILLCIVLPNILFILLNYKRKEALKILNYFKYQYVKVTSWGS
ncbi:hypothetical protein CZ809_02585 [Photobacterium piscicola]|uniref:Polysaccharide biosynthesis protein n=1 Tax=Photobacterium piscicola TaxID=1378299 RepID=A0A1T5I249_9GAMM|nr:oligosaccharide flippase family protein [Photobacterium piscicola]SKC33056.1 hypothetical protein CZ809_02585 [Photobacterium piscicola]